MSDLVTEVISKATNELAGRLDEIVIEGLSRKGFTFENRRDIEAFIVENCRRIRDPFSKVDTYYVKNERFLLHYYSPEWSLTHKHEEDLSESRIKVKATVGRFQFL